MKSFTNLFVLLTFFYTAGVSAVAYDDDEQNFWVEGQVLNESLESVNFFLCIAQAMRPDAFVNAGTYVATLYSDDCETSGADKTADQASATATSAKSSTTATAGSAASSNAKPATTGQVNVSRADASSPVLTRAWLAVDSVPATDQDPPAPAIRLFYGLSQTAGISASSPNGDFSMAFQARTDETVGDLAGYPNDYPEAPEMLISNGKNILYDAGFYEKVSVEYLDNGDKRGVFFQSNGFDQCEGEGPWSVGTQANCNAGRGAYGYVDSYLQYYLSATDKAFCQKVGSVELWIPRVDDNGDWDPKPGVEGIEAYYDITEIKDDLSSYSYARVSGDESCFTVDRSKAQRNVHRYGTYIDGGADDGKRLPITNSAFPLYADVTDGDGEPLKVHAWADYWGVWVENEGRSLINGSTKFYKESFDDSGSTEPYNLKPSDIRIEKRETSYVPLNEIDGLTIRWWAGDAQYDTDWQTPYSNLLGGTPAYTEYEGKFDKDAGSFTLTKGLAFEPKYVEEPLGTPITFTLSDWQTKMVKAHGSVGDDWYHLEKRGMGVWSTDTNQWYDISAEAMAAPTSATKSAGVRTETQSIISPADLTETLYCFRECIDGAKVVQTFTEAVAADASSVTSPFADVGGGLKNAVTITRAHSNYESMSEATHDFWLTGKTLESNGLKLGEGTGAAVTDFVSGDEDVQRHARIHYDGVVNCIGDSGCRAEYFLQDNGLSLSNLNKLLAGDSSNPGKVPVFNLNIRSIPTSGTTGSMKIKVRVLEAGGDEDAGELFTLQPGERAIEAETTVNYASDGSKFTITIPGGAEIDLTYFTSSDSALTGSFTKNVAANFAYAGGAISTGSVSGQSGLSWDFFELFKGHSGISAFSGAGIEGFFENNKEYVASIGISGTSLEMEGPGLEGDKSFKDMIFWFTTRDDSQLSHTETYPAGSEWQGVLASDIYSYSLQSGDIVDKNGNVITKGSSASSALAAMDDPYGTLQNVSFKNSYGDDHPINWGVRTGELVGASDLSKMECRKFGKDETYEWHPILGESSEVTRYCGYQLWEGDIGTKYSISLETESSYSISLESTGQKVVIDQPKALYYTVPETLDSNGNYVFGDDRGKQMRLEYQGHGELHGIPGFVYDTATGEDKGEFVNDWKDDYRYLSRFTIPDGGLLTDPLDSSASYKVKALDGEEWLTKADGSVSGVDDVRGRYSALYAGDKSTLQNDIPEVSNPSDDYYIGPVPTSGFINGGKASVVHGEVVFDPSGG